MFQMDEISTRLRDYDDADVRFPPHINSNKILDGQNFLWSYKIAQTLSHVLGTNLLDQYFCPKNSPTQKIEEF